jgi:hypothetical protein
MKHTLFKVLAIAGAGLLAGLANQANAVTWTFLENGTGNLGTSEAFTSGGFTIWAYGFKTAGGTADLWGKSDGPGETGLGMKSDLGFDHEIDKNHFVQLDSMIVPKATIGGITLGSVQLNEDAAIYGSNTLGSLGTLLGTMPANGLFDLSGFKYRYFGVTSLGTLPASNVVIGSLSATAVPDGGTTALMLGAGLIGLAVASRRSKSAKA